MPDHAHVMGTHMLCTDVVRATLSQLGYASCMCPCAVGCGCCATQGRSRLCQRPPSSRQHQYRALGIHRSAPARTTLQRPWWKQQIPIPLESQVGARVRGLCAPRGAGSAEVQRDACGVTLMWLSVLSVD